MKIGLFGKVTIFIIVVMTVLLFLLSLNRDFDHDEFEALHTSWKILNHEEIYLDFFQHHNPLFYYLLAPVVYFSGESANTLLVARIFMLICLFVIFALIYLMTREVFGPKAALVSLVFASASVNFVKAMEIRPDVLQVLFGLLSIYLLMVYFRKWKLLYLFGSALALAVSFLFLQKAIFLVAMIMAVLLFKVITRRLALATFFFYAGIFLSVMFLFFFCLWATKTMPEYFFSNWAINVSFSDNFSPWFTLGTIIGATAVIWLFYLISFRLAAKDGRASILMVMSIFLLLSASLVRSPNFQYYMMPMVLIVTLAAGASADLLGRKKVLTLFILILSIAYPFYDMVYDINRGNKSQLDKINYVLNLTGPDDYVYDGDIQFNLFRKDLDYYWFSLGEYGALATHQKLDRYDYNVYDLIGRYKPIIISDFLLDRTNQVIVDQYTVSAGYPDLLIRND